MTVNLCITVIVMVYAAVAAILYYYRDTYHNTMQKDKNDLLQV